MNETTNQMSLLDAIGLNAPEETKKTKKEASAEAQTPAEKPKKKKSGKAKVKAESKPEPAQTDAETSERTDEQTIESVSAPVAAEQTDAEDSSQETVAAPTTEDPLTLDKFLCFALYSANHAMHGVYKSLLKEVGLTYPQFLALTVLWETNNVPVGAITSKLQLDTNTLTPLLKRLEAMGLVTRTRNTKDERQVILKLTRKGRALQKKTEHFSSCILSSTGLTMEDVMDLQTKIMKLRDNLRDTDGTS
ncbi:MAG: MarR family transcriptional regulator [Pseudomonadota bacterium]